jgi:hypothetical protein
VRGPPDLRQRNHAVKPIATVTRNCAVTSSSACSFPATRASWASSVSDMFRPFPPRVGVARVVRSQRTARSAAASLPVSMISPPRLQPERSGRFETLGDRQPKIVTVQWTIPCSSYELLPRPQGRDWPGGLLAKRLGCQRVDCAPRCSGLIVVFGLFGGVFGESGCHGLHEAA